MCGIAGIVTPDLSQVSELRLNKMINALAHRGPDGSGYWINPNGNVGFGHRRLSIIDLSSKGDQPMHWQNRYTIVYNGEIYNYIELKHELLKQGETFISSSDTEVILAMYARHKEKCVDHFDGMFSFAIWDQQEQTLFAARDRFGEKPFFYHWNENTETFSFASEMKALWAIGLEKKANDGMMLAFISSGFTQNPSMPGMTFFSGIKKIPQGNYLLYQFRENKITVSNYWKPGLHTVSNLNEPEAIEKFSELLKTSVLRRLRSDVPVGTSLSGGIDSSSIVAVIDGLKKDPGYRGLQKSFSSFSAVFSGYEKDESKYIGLIAKKYELPNFQVTPTVSEFISDLEKLTYFNEEPFPSSSTYAQFKVFELAKKNGIKVLLDGQGADEVLAGYTKYYHWYWQELFIKKGFGAMKEEKQSMDGMGWGIKNYLAAWFPKSAAAALAVRAVKLQRSHPGISREYLRNNFDKSFFYKPVVRELNDILYFNSFQTGLEELLRFADRNSMAHGREVRLPFLSHELVQFIFTLPSNYKIRNGFTKWILRKSMENLLPPQVVWRREKIGFEPPQKIWMQDKNLSDVIYSAKKKLVSNGILNNSVLEKKVKPGNAYDADSYDWRYLSAAQVL
jgi:asparagine synthase (glutamine-hydrolyzing)